MHRNRDLDAPSRSGAIFSSSHARFLKTAVGLAAAAAFGWLLWRGVDAGELGRVLSRLSISSLALALCFVSAAYALRVVRWWRMLRVLEPGLPFSACVRPFLASVAFNNVLPLRAGDALRCVGFRRQLRSPAARVLGTLVVERALDMAVLSGIFFLGLLGLPAGAFPRGFVVAAAWLAGAAAAALLAAAFAPSVLRDVRVRWNAPGHGGPVARRTAMVDAAFRHVAHFIDAMAIARSPSQMLSLCAFSVACWGCEGMAFVVIAADLGALSHPVGPWLSLAAGSLATAIPGAPGYLGTFHYFATQGLLASGAPTEAAAALALTVHALMWILLTVAGLTCYWMPTNRVFRRFSGK